MNQLVLDNITMRFGGLSAVSDLSFSTEKNKITALIGPNGAGKTTTFNLISGLLKPTYGKVSLDNQDLSALEPHQVCKIGIGRSFQTPHIFPNLTALENVMIGSQLQTRTGFLSCGFKLSNSRSDENNIIENAFKELKFLNLEQYSHQKAGTLPLGQQRLLEIARALATKPKLLLLDEPAAGLTQSELNKLREHLIQIKQRNISILLVEHNMRFVFKTVEYVIVMNFGKKLAEGKPDEISTNENVIAAYLGKSPKVDHAIA